MDETPLPPFSPFTLDLNGDGLFTISDLKLWFGEAFYLPGDWLIWLVATHWPVVAQFLEIGVADYGSLLSAFVSAGAWIALVIAVRMLILSLRAVDHALTAGLTRVAETVRRRVRIALALARYRLSRRSASASQSSIDVTAGPELEPLECELLAAHAEIEAPYALTLSDAARAAGRGRHETQRVTEKLAKLGLLERATGGAEDGESAYRLSQAGRAWLLLERLAEPSAAGSVRATDGV